MNKIIMFIAIISQALILSFVPFVENELHNVNHGKKFQNKENAIVHKIYLNKNYSDSLQNIKIANDWLNLLDNDKYPESLKTATPFLQRLAGSAEQWAEFLNIAREAFQKPIERKILSSESIDRPRGAPEGEYWSVAFVVNTNSGTAVERVILLKLESEWKVSMYSVQNM